MAFKQSNMFVSINNKYSALENLPEHMAIPLVQMEEGSYSVPVLPAGISESETRVWEILATVPDPEVPVLSIVDLGIVRKVLIKDQQTKSAETLAEDGSGETLNHKNKHVEVAITITPTYSGCPAMDAIAFNIRVVLLQHGYGDVQLQTVLSPAWTTEWMSEAGKQKLRQYGIAPPNPMQQVCNHNPFAQQEAIQCPRCNSYHTQLVSQFGSTACKAFYQCQDCKEPFDYFKCH